ncbi:hypothetical protein Pflav_089950 [Phytohabitans flavus]|uniref:Bacterial transcriptional activator domain-containing protein n=1 Tax=Phytohabitans flavus TaxID=1076124 RepID=A0A6F8Y909_9ACTN|nr:hypothetical protein Pflav_089950 [Phytohabitans flavus]
MEPSGSLDSDDPQVHALIRDMVRYLRARGDLQGSKELAERAVASWLPRLGEDHTSVLVIRRELASTLLALGGFAEARRTYEDIIPRLAGTLGDKDPYTLWARRGLAGALRGQGQYHAAHRIDTETFPSGGSRTAKITTRRSARRTTWPFPSASWGAFRRPSSSTRRLCDGATSTPAPRRPRPWR